MRQRKVLIVGESQKERARIRRSLKRTEGEHCEIAEARSCDSALRRLKRSSWDGVALCKSLPDEGSDELRRFLAEAALPDLVAEELTEAAILESLHDAVLVTAANPDSPSVLYVNPAFERMTGYSRAEILGRTPKILQGQETDRGELDRIRAALERFEPVQATIINYRKDGTPFDIELNIHPVSDDSGRVVRFVALQRDVTEHNRLLRVVREEQDRINKLVVTSPGLLCSFRLQPDGSVSFPYISKGCREVFGFEPEELYRDASPLFARIFPEDLERIQHLNDLSARTMTEYKIDYRLRHPERGTVWVEVHSMPVAEPDGSIVWHGSTTDITEIKRNRQALQRREAQLAGIINSATDAIITIDDSLNIVVFNNAAEKIFRVAAAEMLGQPLERLLPPRFRTNHDGYIRGFGQTGRTNRSMTSGAELFGLRANGEEFPLEATISQIEDEGTKLYTVILRDITLRKQAEELLRHQSATLTESLAVLKTAPKVEAFLHHILAALARSMDTVSASLWLYDRETDTLSVSLRYSEGQLQSRPAADPTFPVETVAASEFPYWESIVQSRQPFLVDVESHPGIPNRQWLLDRKVHYILLLPLLLGDETIGCINLRRAEQPNYESAELELAQALALQATLAIQMDRMAQQGRQAAVLQERNRFAQDIHDTLAQGFTGILLQLEAAEYAGERSQAQIHIQQARDLARLSLQEARRSVHALRPQALESLGLSGALENLVQRVGSVAGSIPTLQVNGAAYPLAPDVEERLYRIAQEALTNAVRHSEAGVVTVKLAFEPTGIQLTVCDDGKGFDINRSLVAEGFGVIGMYERAGEIGGQLTVTTSPGNGTTIHIVVPRADVK